MPRATIAVGLALVLTAHALAADIGVTPPRLVLAVAPGESIVTTFAVLTNSGVDQAVEATVSDWLLDATGQIAYVPPGTLEHSAADWLTLEVDAFLLRPGGSRELRLEVAVPPDAEGTHHAMVFFTVVPPPGDAQGVGVTTTTRVGLTVYVTVVGTERAGAELVDLFRPDDATLAAVVVNTGNTVMRLGGAVELRDEAGAVVHRLDVPDVPVLRESERELRFDLPDDLPSGFYVALALIQDDRGGLLAGELPFEVP